MSATLSTSDLWMKLESLAHLRGLPQFKNASKAIVAELAAHDAALAPPKPAVGGPINPEDSIPMPPPNPRDEPEERRV